ncbi:DUF2851 family protein [Horticoccus luteus]|uniref:DUF2851 family protein n=2 Tax=Horticoccus luteus TaxID=2862869 RepID=A0A8F9TY53_9BACT|nr:DUF2851 family protein [Horticoccus luteus]
MGATDMSVTGDVAEMQGLYGAFSFPEKLLQRIWATGEFVRDQLTTIDGQRVTIGQAGKWNLLGGPDFKGARVTIGEGSERTGDVELHLRAEDWANHRHAADPAYRNVILHVVLFPPAAGHVTRGAGGEAIPVAALLPLLHRDLESYADDAAVESLVDQPLDEALREWVGRSAEELTAMLREHAKTRWQRKVRDANRRIERLGWSEACHHAALEILGYRFNRVPMLRTAARWRLAEWVRRGVDPDVAWAAERESWSVQGVRPANHPRVRLRQYATWVRARPDWPEALISAAGRVFEGAGVEATRTFRHKNDLTARRRAWSDLVAGEAVGGTRWDNLVCDGFLPLMAARTGEDLFAPWWHWFSGDLPEGQERALRRAGVFGGRENPAAHGPLQGLLGWRLAREATSAGRGA